MNLLVPDSWLRQYLKTKATPFEIKEYLSLCGPSVERIHEEKGEVVYDIEITSNRPDAMSVVGVAREAAAILPRFGLAAKLEGNPYELKKRLPPTPSKKLPLVVKTDPQLNPRWTSIIFDQVKVGPSPEWLKKWLTLSGVRSLNNIIDITNFLMRAFGQPAHAFDYDTIRPKNGVPTMILRASKPGEKLTTLDDKTHTLPGDDIVIEDGSGRLIDLCGIMGGENSSVTSTTKRVVLFLQTYEPTHIRRTSMTLAHRTEAASLFEKGVDSELVLPAILVGAKMIKELAGGVVASQVFDLYPSPYQPATVSIARTKLDAYLGVKLTDKEIASFLSPLGFSQKITPTTISVRVPSFRRDVEIDVDIIEEVARIYGYHHLTSRLPEGELPMIESDPLLRWEEEVKTRLRDWGYTETYTYSMISEELMDIFELDKTKAYQISNPLSSEWVFMRPTLWPSVLTALKQNLSLKSELKLFELSMVYGYQGGDLPVERPTLLVAWTGDKFFEAKGLAEALFNLFGIPFPVASRDHSLDWYHPRKCVGLGKYGSLGIVSELLQNKLELTKPVTLLELDFARIVADAKPTRTYAPIPKYPPSFEDLAFILPPETPVGPLIALLTKAHPLVAGVRLLDTYGQTRTLHITYQDLTKNLTSEDLVPIREKLITIAQEKFGATLKST